MSTNFPGSPHMMGCVGFSRQPIFQAFPILWKIDEKTHVFTKVSFRAYNLMTKSKTRSLNIVGI